MIKHYSRRHLELRNYSCTFCDKNFKSEENRRRHYISKHDMHLSSAEIRRLGKNPNVPT